jgi:hypothetical protein
MSSYRYDKFFDFFLKKFGEPHSSQPVSQSEIDKYQEKLPEQLFTYWKTLGWCGYGDGLVWMVDSSLYEGILTDWLRGSPFEHRQDLSVVMRTAFGELSIWAKGKGRVIKINPALNVIYHYPDKDANDYTDEEEGEYMRRFWGMQKREYLDYDDESDTPLFDRTFKELGSLKSDEVYGFKHHHALGGAETLDNLEVMKLDVYHDICRQIANPKLITQKL